MNDEEKQKSAAAEQRISRMRTKILLNYPFWSTLFMLMKLKDATTRINTFSTDGTYLYYNRDHVMNLPDEHLIACLIKQVGHCFLRHMYRMDGRDPEIWNQAGSAIIKHLLSKDPKIHFPPEAMEPIGVEITDDSYVEQVYALLKAMKQPGASKKPGKSGSGKSQDSQNAGGSGQGQNDSNNQQKQQKNPNVPPEDPRANETTDPTGDFRPPRNDLKDDQQDKGKGNDGDQDQDNGNDPANDPGNQQPQNGQGQQCGQSDDDMSEADWQVAVEQAIMAGKKAGTLPALLERLIDTDKAKTDSQDLLQVLNQFIQNTIPSDYSFRKPNRKFLSSGLYVPGIIKENAPELVVGIDTSGSVTHKMLEVAGKCLTDIMHEYRPEKMTIIYCDTRVNRIDEFEPDDSMVQLHMCGGGGTSFQPVFDKVVELGIEPAAMIYITDLYGPRPTKPEYPVLWVTTEKSSANPPFGQMVRVDPDHYSPDYDPSKEYSEEDYEEVW